MLAPLLSWSRKNAPGLSLALVIGVVAHFLGRHVPVIGGPVLGIVLGALIGSQHRTRSPQLEPGLGFAARPVLQSSIVLLGATLSAGQVLRVGLSSLPVMLGSLVIALVVAWVVGPRLRLEREATTLIGIGTAVCGASAIAAAAAVIKPTAAQVGYALGTIFAFNVAAVLTFPALGHLMQMDQQAFGLWAGTAINDTSSVVAAAYSYGPQAGDHAVVVKLTRALMIVPIVVGLALLTARHEGQAGTRLRPASVLPPFIVGFVVAAGLHSAGVIPAAWAPTLAQAGILLMTIALAAIGLRMRLADVRRAGPAPLALGALLWVVVALSSLGLQALTGMS